MNAFLLALVLLDNHCITLPHPLDISTSGGGRHFTLQQIRNGRTGLQQIVFTFVEGGTDNGFTSGVELVYMHGPKSAVSGRFRKHGRWVKWSFRTDGARVHLERLDVGFLSERIESAP